MTKEIVCAQCGVSGGYALYCLSCTEKFFIKGKEWVGLTDEEMQSIAFESADALSAVFVAEAKLKDRNEH